MYQISVCATSANVCIGFDVLGLALDLKNHFYFEKSDCFEYEGFDECYCNSDNLLVKAYCFLFEKQGKEIQPVKITIQGKIPIARGLGSSSSLIVAGIFAANHFLNSPYTKDELFQFCCLLEGHPDNVAPAIYGGLVATLHNSKDYEGICLPVSSKLKCYLIIPEFEVSTEFARGVLPSKLSYQQVVNNLSRIIHLPKAFEDGDLALLCKLFKDELHEPYRSTLIPEYQRYFMFARESGLPLSISGSGSSMILFSNKSIDENLEKMPYPFLEVSIGCGVEEVIK